MSTSTVDSAPTLTQRLSSSGPEMDRRLKRDVKRGRLRPEARIDLHGMTLDDAHGALSGFIVACHGRGCQIVLVITGKGRGGADRPGQIPAPRGRLRHQVPDWLNAGPLRALVKGVMPAAQRHGGEGAYYVWLRRNG